MEAVLDPNEFLDGYLCVRTLNVAHMFPPATDIAVNMMPMLIHCHVDSDNDDSNASNDDSNASDDDHLYDHFKVDVATLPSTLHSYAPLINMCIRLFTARTATRVAFLTIDESWVEEGTSQRRPGLHTDAHLNPYIQMPANNEMLLKGGETNISNVFAWGLSFTVDGGIVVVSTCDNSTAVWDAQVSKPGLLGDCENLRKQLENTRNYHVLRRGEVCYMTDMTPHESLPLTTRCYRQFMRIVLGHVDVWYSKHSTPNPLINLAEKLPDLIITDQDKFNTCYLLW